jgi:hypothetical protein
MNKRLRLFLFLFLPAVCFPDSLSNALLFRHLWTDESGTAWQRKITSDTTINFPGFSVEPRFAYNEIQSTVSVISGGLSSFSTGINVTGKYAGIDAGGMILQGRDISVLTDHEYNNEKIDAAAGYVSLPVFVKTGNPRNDVTITPFFSAACSSAGNGSFYWFFGKPVIPEFFDTGLSVKYKPFRLTVHTGRLELDINNNSDENLIQASLLFAGAVFSSDFTTGSWKLKPAFGYLYVNGTFSGSLTAENQLYLFFPYTCYSVEGSVLCHFLTTSFDCSYRADFFVFALQSAAVFFPEQTGIYEADWKYKDSLFFDGSSGSESGSLNSMNMAGCVFVTPSVTVDMTSRRLPLVITLSKLFVVPFSFAEHGTDSENQSTDTQSAFNEQQLLSWLFSGITLNVSFKI